MHPHDNTGEARSPDTGHSVIPEMVEPEAQGQAKRVGTNKKTLPVGKSKHIHPDGRTELLPLHYQTSEESLLGHLPTGIKPGFSVTGDSLIA